MKKILELLYYGQINEAERPTEPECIETSTPDEEDKTYDALYASLSPYGVEERVRRLNTKRYSSNLIISP